MNIMDFFDYGRHTAYVLSAWGVTIGILGGIALQSYLSWRRSERKRQELDDQK